MDSNKRTSRTAGILIIIGGVVDILSIVPAIEDPGYLKNVYPKRNLVLIGAFFNFC